MKYYSYKLFERKMKFSALRYIYLVFLENQECKNCYGVFKEEFYKVIHDSFLNENHDCNDASMNSMNVNCANDIQNYKLGVMSLMNMIFLVPLLMKNL